jgi:hypothetical protein
MASGFTLATYVQRKMELNNHCSPDLLNVRRQKRLTSLPLNKIMTVSRLTPNIEQHRCSVVLVELTGIEPVTSCLQSRRSPN